ncbi:hypothetical protein IKF33_01460 [Candidatus Saccharibacteria bacterium]|nr:hypothetical protein [Candidatus Saccharibacteria bacterium]
MDKNPELPNKTSESTAETQWSELEQLGEDGFQGKSELTAAQKEQESFEESREDALEDNKEEHLDGRQIQEIVERELNSRLLAVEQLEAEVKTGNPQVQKRYITFEGKEIPVYDLNGYPYAMLTTVVDYKKGSGRDAETARAVTEDPAIWLQTQEETQRSNEEAFKGHAARGDVIFASYSNSEKNRETVVGGEDYDLTYGWSRVEKGSIIEVNANDSRGSNVIGENGEPRLDDPDIINKLEGADRPREFNKAGDYNEVIEKRYSEDGTAKPPDYIVVRNGRVTDAAKRHAKFYLERHERYGGPIVPIINIEESYYVEKDKERGEKIIGSISENDDYLEIDKKMSELLSISQYRKEGYDTRKSIGRDIDIPKTDAMTEDERKWLEVSEIELSKRLDFAKSTLQEVIEKIESATEEEKVLPADYKPSQFEEFDVAIHDAQKLLWEDKNGEGDRGIGSIKYKNLTDAEVSDLDVDLFSSNSILIKFRLKDSSTRRVVIYENKESHDEQDYYDAFEPIVRKYFEAYRKNQELENH